MKLKALLKTKNLVKTFGKLNLSISVFCLLFFIIMSGLIISRKVDNFDEFILTQLSKIFPVWFVYISKGIYFLGEAEVAVFIVLFSLIILCYKKLWYEAQILAVSSLGILLLIDKVLKPLFNRDRPLERLVENINGKSYPSGHASGNLFLYLFLAYILSAYYPKFKVYFYLFAIFLLALMGISSAYLRVHWVTDILGAYCVGYIFFSIAIVWLKLFDKKYKIP